MVAEVEEREELELCKFEMVAFKVEISLVREAFFSFSIYIYASSMISFLIFSRGELRLEICWDCVFFLTYEIFTF